MLHSDVCVLDAKSVEKAGQHCHEVQQQYAQRFKVFLQKYNYKLPHVELKGEGACVYRACSVRPDDLAKSGGWKSTADTVTLYSNGNSDGTVCFTESLQVATIFLKHKHLYSRYREAYLYALPGLVGHFYKPESPWAQYFVPGAYPVTQGFMVRKMIDFTSDMTGVVLSKPKFYHCTMKTFTKKSDPQFGLFMRRDTLLLPEEHSYGDAAESAPIYKLK